MILFERVSWMVKRRRETSGELGVRQMEGGDKIEASTYG